MQPPVVDPPKKRFYPRIVTIIVIVVACLFIVAGVVAIYSAMQLNDEMQETIQDLSGPAP